MEAFVEWLSSNELITYPFKEDSTLVSTTGFQLGQDVLVDAVIKGGDDDDRVYLSDLITDPDTIFLFFSSEKLGVVVAEFEIDRVAASVRKLFFSGPVDDLSVCRDPAVPSVLNTYEMRLLVGAGILGLGDALDEDFTADTAGLEPSITIPRPARVLSLADKEFPLDCLGGNIFIGDGYNMAVVENLEQNSLDFTAGQGLGLGSLIECPSLDEVPRKIRTINLKPGERDTRNYRIVSGDDCIEIRHYRASNMIVIHDHCRECCDCDLLTTLDARITALETP